MALLVPALLLVLGCLSCSIVSESSESVSPDPASLGFEIAGGQQLSEKGALQNTLLRNQKMGANTYTLNFGPQVVKVRASYRDNLDAKIDWNDNPPPGNLEGYIDLRATAALRGTNLLSENEMAYDLQHPLNGSARPAMLRLGVKNQWKDLAYGAHYKSVQKGFTPISGAPAEQSKDETILWGEHGSGTLKLRAALGESWERLADAAEARVTRTALSALQINRPRWGGSFSTSYGLTEQGSGSNTESAVLLRQFTTSFRPHPFLLLEPNVSMKDEWNQSTGVKTQTPASALSLTYSPRQSGLRLTGGTFFSRTFNGDAASDVRTHGASALLDWRLGRLLGQDDRLLFTFKYNRHLEPLLRGNFQHHLSSMLQFKVVGF
jgi:hypothetical protein